MIVHISAKCSDLFTMSAEGVSGYYDGYVPDFFPEDHQGDAIILTIDTKTGKILNWPKSVKDSSVIKLFPKE